MRAEVLDDETALRELAPAWGSLAERSSSATVFQTPDWVLTWWRSFGPGKRLATVVVREQGEVVGLAPLAVSRWEGFRHLGFLGAGLADYEDVLVDDAVDRARVLAAIAAALVSNPSWDFFLTNRLPDDSPNLQALNGTLRSASVRPFSTARHVLIEGSWEAYEAALPKKLRDDTRRRRRRLGELGPVGFRRPSGEEEVDGLMRDVVAMHLDRRTRVKGDYSLFEESTMVEFYHRLARTARRGGFLELEALEVAGRPVAVHFGFRYKGRFYHLVPVMAGEMASYAPGRLLLLHLIEESFRRGDREFDMCLGDESYKLPFATHSRRLLTLAVYRSTPRGRAASAWFSRLRPLASSVLGGGTAHWLRRRGVLGRFS